MTFVTSDWGTPVRKTDPHTSHNALNGLKAGSQRERLLRVYAFAARDGVAALTAEEAFHYGTEKLGMNISKFSYGQRVSELLQMGLIYYVEEDHIGESGKPARAFHITKGGLQEIAINFPELLKD